MPTKHHLTLDQKLKFLKREWGYVEVTKVTFALSGYQKYLVKNYKGKLPELWRPGDPLPGNPRATRKIEITGYKEKDAMAFAVAAKKRRRRKSK